MTVHLFTIWFTETYCSKKKKRFLSKYLCSLTMNPRALKMYSKINVAFMPTNITSTLQPMDQRSIFQTLFKKYIKVYTCLNIHHSRCHLIIFVIREQVKTSILTEAWESWFQTSWVILRVWLPLEEVTAELLLRNSKRTRSGAWRCDWIAAISWPFEEEFLLMDEQRK